MHFLQRLMSAVSARLPSASLSTHPSDALLQLELTREVTRLQNEIRETMPDNPAVQGFKVYSQADEDGILEHICDRLQLERGSFIEIGCGDGRENNTHYLLLKGWHGVWVDGNAANIASIRAVLPEVERLRVVQKNVTRENVASIALVADTNLIEGLDLLSVDIDGNDLAIARIATTLWIPKIVVCEYNAKFPYPIIAEVAYDPEHVWSGDDYHGSSLSACVQALQSQYRLICCNLAGTNAFFVRLDMANQFEAYPPERLYQPARFYLTALRSGHVASLSFLRNELASDSNRSPSAGQ